MKIYTAFILNESKEMIYTLITVPHNVDISHNQF
ncbi:hypothetical protein SRABI27_03751 [Pedobacter sp. Bi27]|nr:hypothetical protein SRABI27_03751 [Pedobacter sp. Bi27]